MDASSSSGCLHVRRPYYPQNVIWLQNLGNEFICTAKMSNFDDGLFLLKYIWCLASYFDKSTHCCFPKTYTFQDFYFPDASSVKIGLTQDQESGGIRQFFPLITLSLFVSRALVSMNHLWNSFVIAMDASSSSGCLHFWCLHYPRNVIWLQKLAKCIYWYGEDVQL
ncbi:hypothetical protein CEXT_461591 [Caerostris extrusa]|uniref:Uncharacterized protein n=1 Tax=Caerostris extrusa TaxID=172846 RepID=A0AAV4X3B8_CAEEX|nr:hypothetical protein CEXT_461591 [Caerostris extrusa]